MLTREKLERLGMLMREAKGIEEEISALEWELKGEKTWDTVTGSSAEYPYSKRLFTVMGVPEENRTEYARLKKSVESKKRQHTEKMMECTKERKALTMRIRRIQDPVVRRIIFCKYREGLSWEETANQMGSRYTANGVRMAVNRWLMRQ